MDKVRSATIISRSHLSKQVVQILSGHSFLNSHQFRFGLGTLPHVSAPLPSEIEKETAIQLSHLSLSLPNSPLQLVEYFPTATALSALRNIWWLYQRPSAGGLEGLTKPGRLFKKFPGARGRVPAQCGVNRSSFPKFYILCIL